ncbi:MULTISPECIES: FadR/GntR family transcriptional regulator [unclassified Microbacterium]|uniref:FadR/GntR family transcriptional regulator n=1 Tax=unclassified Microbacterium TaxID=2609290 RepID=UPI00048FF17E|nr:MULTISPECIES: FCD domain-containing protein [unclassified Microbacterium]PQZ47991.1 FadR family transcriptional regulator [Microbacterium sp. MYb43]PQZ68947.1 FadR family transcriptional regulator [Microbacterium sp. MYb40]PRB13862.1 FadR family transcriptional regulator [Microbacterium sp. MYb54]PRB20008.1 FadR family transcriptional regulator [Microbacterium sp. MYb50]PRB57588.1 FadR family transcriptional regulator [Microbacterium sp. MYb24]
MSALDTALHGLRALIADGTLRPGDRLPSEGELCERLGVSRGSLREAIRMLAALGVLDTRHGSGSYVSELRAADLIGSLSLTVGLLPMAGVLELTELRRVLEPHAAALAAARIDEQTVESLDRVLDEIESTTDFELQSRLDHEFHMAISGVAGNEALTSLIDVLRSRSRAYRISDPEDAAELKVHSDAGHRAILRGLAAADPVAASAAASAHVAYTEYWVRKYSGLED